jgi:pimeloyl-ACP methyl ester carboxylesterase
MTPDDAKVAANVARRLDGLVADLQLADSALGQDGRFVGSMRRRRSFAAPDYNGLATLALVQDEGVVRWVYQPPGRGPLGRRARRAAARAIGDEVVHEFSFRETPPNRVISALEELDKKLTPSQGLRRLQNGKLEPAGNIALDGRVLLLVHGTFSKSDMFVDELNATAAGRTLLARAAAEYDAILAFDHATLSVSPWINALDLEAALAGVTGPIDVICHSRGGLVVAWWLRNAKRQVDNVVFVGVPLEGTSLASPANLRSALQGLANVFKALEATGALASTIVPFMAVVTGLSKILGGILQLGASTPITDAAVVIVPGLAGQSRVGNNAELDRLNRMQWISTPVFHAVISNFQPGEANEQWWQVWKLLRNPGGRVLHLGADTIFQENNDLVVNTQSMTRLCGNAIKKAQVHDFRDSATVHHLNYFRQNETVALVKKALKL